VVALLTQDQRLLDTRAVKLQWTPAQSIASQSSPQANSGNSTVPAAAPVERRDSAGMQKAISPQAAASNLGDTNGVAVPAMGRGENAAVQKPVTSQAGESNTNNPHAAAVQSMEHGSSVVNRQLEPPPRNVQAGLNSSFDQTMNYGDTVRSQKPNSALGALRANPSFLSAFVFGASDRNTIVPSRKLSFGGSRRQSHRRNTPIHNEEVKLRGSPSTARSP
jgi:hypothetical protein